MELIGRRLLCIAAIAGFANGCGYGFVQRNSPFGYPRIAVRGFDEATSIGLSADLTRALGDRLAAGGVRVTAEQEPGGAVLHGRIESSRTTPSPTSVALGARITAYRITVRVEATLADAGGATLWSTTLNLSEDFLPASGDSLGDDTLVTESNRRRALKRLAERAARELHTQLILTSGAASRSGPEG